LLQTHSCAIPLPPPGRPREQVLGNTVQARLLLHLNGARFGFLRLRQRYDYWRPRDRPHHFGNAEIYAERGLEFPSAKILPRVALVKIGASSRDAASCPNSETPTPASPPTHEIGSSMLRSAYPPGGGTPSISLIPPWRLWSWTLLATPSRRTASLTPNPALQPLARAARHPRFPSVCCGRVRMLRHRPDRLHR
jgi:hypothetical protein